MNNRIVSEKYMTGETKYHFCPYCVKELEHEGKFYKDFLKPLKKVVTAEPMLQNDDRYQEVYDEHYECSRCKSVRITVDTFRLYYTARWDGTKWNEAPKDNFTIWNKEKRCLVPAKWNTQLQKYEEA